MDLLFPLSFMRSVRGSPKLSYEKIEPDTITEPYRSLLVHEGDMTSRLEAYHESSLRVRRLRSSNDGKSYFREVVLETESTAKATEYGAIEISLGSLPEEIHPLVVEAKLPLGSILNNSRIPYSCFPRAYLKIVPDGPIVDALGTVEADVLYGRSNEIRSFNDQVIARIVEILPPS